ncbi:condensation domain-containing protein [Pseudooceanicola aestuarii]|uniref:condensation domain-containing protein n=1 Tax=Pseudooceanicola aestuarii TaxID=2697319 RepID=UPI0013CFBD1A|nr:condensation domain-containing protein [Pseudooceanicola aestuarii]
MTGDPRHSAPDPEARARVTAEVPLSANQRRFWFLDRVAPGDPSLNVAVRWELRGALSCAALENAITHVIDRHEVLRSRYLERGETPLAQVLEHAPFRLDVVDLRAVPAPGHAARIEDIARQVAARPFDLGQAGHLRATLIRLSGDRAILVLVAHHICFDGWSIRVLGAEVGAAFAALSQGATPELPPLALHYGDFALWQAELLATDTAQEDIAYWRAQLGRGTPYELRPDLPRPARRQTGVAQVSLDLPQDFGPRLKATARAMGVSRFTLGVALFAACLHRLQGGAEARITTQVAGRTELELEPLIGVFINTLVLRLPTTDEATLADHVSTAAEVVEGALIHQDLPFDRIVGAVNPPRDPARLPLAGVNFNLQDVFMQGGTFGGVEFVSSPSHTPGAIHDLDLAVMGRPSGWQVTVEYATALYRPETAEALIGMMAQAFELLFRDPKARLSELPLPPVLARRDAAEDARIGAAEQALMSCALVGQAVVVPAGTGLFGFVVPGATGAVPLEDLPRRITAALAGHPALTELTGLSLLGALPLGNDGLPDRALLLPPPQEGLAAAPGRGAEVLRGGEAGGSVDTGQGALAAPAPDAVMQALAADWAEILNHPAPQPGDNFFDLGGHSVLVLRQLARLRARWSITLDVTQFYEHATLAALADLVRRTRAALETGAEDGPDWRLMTLREDGTGQPLIAVNNFATALALSNAGGVRRPARCIRIFDRDRGIDLTAKRFEDVAADCAALIRKAQPDGPYLLYGNCVHGNLALEAARLLHAQGAEIRAVVMKDVWEPAYTDGLRGTFLTRWGDRVQALRNALRALRRGEMSLTAFLGRFRMIRATGLPWALARLGLLDAVRKTDMERDEELFVSAISRLRDVYRPGPVDFPVLHVVTDITPQGRNYAPSIGWDRLLSPELLQTVHLPRVSVHGGRRDGVEDMARHMAEFLGEGAMPPQFAPPRTAQPRPARGQSDPRPPVAE